MRFRRDPSPPALAEDRALAQRMLTGDEAAFDDFFETQFPRLYRFAVARVHDAELARELVQNAICKAIANLAGYRGEASLTAWLFTICRYEISGHYRAKRRAPRPVELDESPEVQAALASLPASDHGPDAELRRKEVVDRVHRVLDHLPARYGRALEWKYMEGLSVKEIAQRLAVSPKAAESLLTRARNAFRDGMAALPPEGPPGSPAHPDGARA